MYIRFQLGDRVILDESYEANLGGSLYKSFGIVGRVTAKTKISWGTSDDTTINVKLETGKILDNFYSIRFILYEPREPDWEV